MEERVDSRHVSIVLVSVATAWSAVEDFEEIGREGGGGKAGEGTCDMLEDSQQGLHLPFQRPSPTHKKVFFSTYMKKKHVQNKRREKLMNWHPCFISVTHLADSALGLVDVLFYFACFFQYSFCVSQFNAACPMSML
jgi:hypothetical protein